MDWTRFLNRGLYYTGFTFAGMAKQLFIGFDWNKQEQVFLHNLSLLRQGNSHRAVHDTRVATKKLRSYLKLLAGLEPAIDHQQNFRETESLFRVLGKQRDIGMGLDLLAKYESKTGVSYGALKEHFEAVNTQADHRVETAIKSFNEKEFKNLSAQVTRLDASLKSEKFGIAIQRIINQNRVSLARLSTQLDRQAHKIRKVLKDIFYWAGLGAGDKLLPAPLLSKIKKTMEVLGHWQDHEMLLRKIKHYRKDFVPSQSAEFQQLKDLENKISNKMEALLRTAERGLKSINS